MRTSLERASNRIYRYCLVSLPHSIGITHDDSITGLLDASFNRLITPYYRPCVSFICERLRTMPRTTSAFVNRLPYLPRAGTTAAYGGRTQHEFIFTNLPANLEAADCRSAADRFCATRVARVNLVENWFSEVLSAF